MMEYTIVHGRTTEELVKGVEAKIADGWQPLCGVSAVATMTTQKMVGGGTVIFNDPELYQAMVKMS